MARWSACGIPVKITAQMRLGEALRIIQQATGDRHRQIHLLCSFTPLHFATFVKAYSSLRFPGDSICLHTGLYGDLEGNIQRARDVAAEGTIAVAEWDDFDPRLGLRSSSDWG